MKNDIPSLVFVFALFFTLVSCSTDETHDIAEDPVLTAEFHTDISYGNHPQQVYDIYLPKGRSSKTTKVLILVHGGGWTQGDKEDMNGFLQFIKENHPNHAVVNMNYVLATETKPAFPNQILDVGRVINHLSSKSEILDILPEFGLIGVSAGAHLSLMYDYVYDTKDQVKLVCDIVGPADFTDPFYTENPNYDFLIPFLVNENAYPPETNYKKVLSPVFQVSAQSSPTILFYGNKDQLVPLSNARRLDTALTENGIPHSLTVYNGGHGNWDLASYQDLGSKLSDFIHSYLKIHS